MNRPRPRSATGNTWSQCANLFVTQPATHPERVNTLAMTGMMRNTHRLVPVGAVREPPTTAIGLGKNAATYSAFTAAHTRSWAVHELPLRGCPLLTYGWSSRTAHDRDPPVQECRHLNSPVPVAAPCAPHTYTDRVTPGSRPVWQAPATETAAAALLQRLPVPPC